MGRNCVAGIGRYEGRGANAAAVATKVEKKAIALYKKFERVNFWIGKRNLPARILCDRILALERLYVVAST